jgi:hypothetical protein
MRETVQDVSGDQRFKSCSYKSASQTKICVCFKSSLKCNGRCHLIFLLSLIKKKYLYYHL